VLSGTAFVDAVSLVPEPGVCTLGWLGVAVWLGVGRGKGISHKRAQREKSRNLAGA
jgi:hypothetical protein